VRAYFAQMAALQTGPTGDPTELANKLLASAMGGDPSAFDSFIQTAQDAADKARALSVPAACADYHREMLALLDDGLTLMHALKSAIGKQDTDALAAMASTAADLQRRTEGLEQEGRRIKARFGLTH